VVGSSADHREALTRPPRGHQRDVCLSGAFATCARLLARLDDPDEVNARIMAAARVFVAS